MSPNPHPEGLGAQRQRTELTHDVVDEVDVRLWGLSGDGDGGEQGGCDEGDEGGLGSGLRSWANQALAGHVIGSLLASRRGR
jgi:hypothetical protein